MSKRYVFWRMPDGRAYRGIDGKYSPTALLAELGEMSDVSSEGNVTWRSFDFKRFEVALEFASVVVGPDGEELNETDSGTIIRASLTNSIKNKGGKQPLIPNEFLKIADSKAAEYFRKQANAYRLVSGLSVETLPFRSVSIRGCRLDALSSRRRYPIPNSIQLEDGSEIATILENSRNKLVLVRTSGRTVFEAADAAFRALNLLRGLWSLFATYGSWSISFGLRRDPMAVINAGPVHTLHYPDGKLATDVYWYERDLRGSHRLFGPQAGWKKIENCRRWAMRRLDRLPYRKDIENLIIRYELALDQSDHDVAFLQMWSILEKLTSTVGASYDETLKRTIWPWDDRIIAKDFLECARLRRNMYVHAARSSETPDQIAYIIKGFVDPHLLALIRNDFRISRLEEYGQVLSIPSDLKTLEREKKWIDKALQMTRNRSRAKP